MTSYFLESFTNELEKLGQDPFLMFLLELGKTIDKKPKNKSKLLKSSRLNRWLMHNEDPLVSLKKALKRGLKRGLEKGMKFKNK